MGRKRRKLFSIVRKGFSKEVQDESPTVQLQVGKHLWESVPRSMRTELWLSVLHRRGLGTAASKKFQSLLKMKLPPDVTDTIDKDLARTFPDIRRFTTQEGQDAMGRVLRAYAAYDPDIGYCQGMNFLAGMLILYMPTEAHAFGALVVLMYERGLRELYDTDMSLLQVRLWQLGRLLPKELLDHLEGSGCLTVLYASSWILTSFISDFPYQVAARIVDVLMADSFKDVVLKVALTVLVRNKRELMRIKEMEEIVNFLTTTVPGWKLNRLHELLSEALATPWTEDQLAILDQTSNVETVEEAVSRVEFGIVSPRDTMGSNNGEAPIAAEQEGSKSSTPSLLHIPPVASWNSRSGGRTPTSAKSTFESPTLLSPDVIGSLVTESDPPLVVKNPKLTPIDLDSIDNLGLQDPSPNPVHAESSNCSELDRLDSWAWVSAEPSPVDSQAEGSSRRANLSMSDLDTKSSIGLYGVEGSLGLESGENASMDGETRVKGKDKLGWYAGVKMDSRRRKAMSGSDVSKDGLEFQWIEAVVRDMPR